MEFGETGPPPTATQAAASAQKAKKPSAADVTADAKARKAVADAEAAEIKNATDVAAAVTPKISDVKDGSLDLKGAATPLLAQSLGFRALRDAAEKVAQAVTAQGIVPAGARILVTSDADLATADASFLEVVTGITELGRSADSLLTALEPKTDVGDLLGDAHLEGVIAAPVILGMDVLAKAIPGIVSALHTSLAVRTETTTADDSSAILAVAGQLRDLHVVLDDFRLLPEPSRVLALESMLRSRRAELVATKLKIELSSASEDAPGRQVPPATPPSASGSTSVDTAAHAAAVDPKLAAITALVSAIDGFVKSINAVPAGKTRSALGTAVHYERLHAWPTLSGDQRAPHGIAHLHTLGGDGRPSTPPADDDRFTHVLLVKAHTGDVVQLIQRPAALKFWGKTRFSTLVDAAITYALIDTARSQVKAAGVESASTQAQGSITDVIGIEHEGGIPS
jgi:hypothetical protein